MRLNKSSFMGCFQKKALVYDISFSTNHKFVQTIKLVQTIFLFPILIKHNNDKIWMDIYYKPTDIHRCLPFSSNHPKHCKNNIPFTLARCICTIVENNEPKMKHLEDLRMNLSKYQYPKQLTEFGINKALSIPLQELDTPKTISNDNSLPFITLTIQTIQMFIK